MKDLYFLRFSSFVVILLIVANYPLFIKTLGSSKFANSQIKQAAQQIKIEKERQKEQEFWDGFKEIDFDQIETKPDVTKIQESPIPRVKPTFLEPEQKKQEKPYTHFLLLGDSIMYYLGTSFETKVNKTSYQIDTIKVEFKISSGLNRIDFYNWYSRTSKLISQYKPDVLVVVFGGNDDQDILDKNGVYRTELTPAWENAYQERVERYANLLDKSTVRKVYWIGHPISNVKRYNIFFPIFNKIYKRVSKNHPKIEFLDCWNLFADQGKFAPIVADQFHKKGRVRTDEGVHPTEHGANIIIDYLIQKMMDDNVLLPKKHI